MKTIMVKGFGNDMNKKALNIDFGGLAPPDGVKQSSHNQVDNRSD